MPREGPVRGMINFSAVDLAAGSGQINSTRGQPGHRPPVAHGISEIHGATGYRVRSRVAQDAAVAVQRGAGVKKVFPERSNSSRDFGPWER